MRLQNCAVISVGNIAVGGAGKTPAVQYVARLLQENGARVAVVARGYGGALAKRGAIVSDGQRIFHEAREIGDEPLLHARALPGVPVVIGIDRVRAAQIALEKFAPDVIVLDDAFQFYSLHRDLDVVLCDARRPLGNGFLLPRGTLREETSALHRADVLLLTRADRATATQLSSSRERLRALCDAPFFECEHAPVKLLRVNFEKPPPENASDETVKNVAREYSQRASAGAKTARDERDENANSMNVAPQKNSREYSQQKNDGAREADRDVTKERNEKKAFAHQENVRASSDSPQDASREYSRLEKSAAREATDGIAQARAEKENLARNENRAAENGEYSLEWLRGKTVGAASALSDNNGFRATLETLGARVVTHCARRDHHKWRDGEIVAVARESAARGASALIVTEKDAVKISRFASQKSAIPILALGIELRVTRGESELRDVLTQVASTRDAKNRADS